MNTSADIIEFSLPEILMLRAGALSLQYEAGALRYLKVGGIEILHQIYAAVRDANWATIPGQITDFELDKQANSFQISYVSHHQQGDVDFVWNATITGRADNTLTFHFAGEARSTFQRNRIGFCVLHPMTCADAACRVEQVDGTQIEGVFPHYIAPHQPFKNIRAIQHEAAPGLWAEVRMEGDTFEMEDQRNWTDASFKTYCTPLEQPFPVTVEQGTHIEQTITVKLLNVPSIAAEESASTLRLMVDDQTAYPLPPLGLGMASHDEPLSPRAIERLKALNLAHLRLDLYPNRDGAEVLLKRAADEARALGVGVEIALHLTDEAKVEVLTILVWVNQLQVPVVRWLIFRQGGKTTHEKGLLHARSLLRKGVPIGAGTDAFFAEINRGRPPAERVDFVTYSSNPQVHAFDNASWVETLPVLPVTVESAAQFSGGKPVVISPITLKMRWNPNATAPSVPVLGDLPPQVDVRQMSLFGAGWTLGSLKFLATSGVAALTYYETIGWLGVMERESGAPLPEQFPSIPGGVYPMYHVFADVGEFAGGQALACFSSDSMRVEGLVLGKENRLRLMVVNFTAVPQTVQISGLEGRFSQRVLDAQTAPEAMRDPEIYRARGGEVLHLQNDAALNLPPYALITLDRQNS